MGRLISIIAFALALAAAAAGLGPDRSRPGNTGFEDAVMVMDAERGR